MAKKQKKKRRIIRPKTPEYCAVCKEGIVLTYKDSKVLGEYVSDRARMYGKLRTGFCSKHQRLLSREIKRARYLGLLSYSPNL